MIASRLSELSSRFGSDAVRKFFSPPSPAKQPKSTRPNIMLKQPSLQLAAILGLTTVAAIPAVADDAALLDILVRKHILTEKEAAKVQ
jgi:hypothetical protein